MVHNRQSLSGKIPPHKLADVTRVALLKIDCTTTVRQSKYQRIFLAKYRH